MAPLLTRRGAQPYVEQIVEWVSDELRLLPAEVLAQPALIELLAAYQLPALVEHRRDPLVVAGEWLPARPHRRLHDPVDVADQQPTVTPEPLARFEQLAREAAHRRPAIRS